MNDDAKRLGLGLGEAVIIFHKAAMGNLIYEWIGPEDGEVTFNYALLEICDWPIPNCFPWPMELVRDDPKRKCKIYRRKAVNNVP